MDLERIPVLVGVGRATQKEINPARIPSPVDMMEEVARLAAEDLRISDAAEFMKQADCFATVNVGKVGVPKVYGGDNIFRDVFPNPAASVASRFGASPKPEKTYQAEVSGHMPQVTVNAMADLIGKGEIKTCVITGCENINLLKKVAPKDKGLLDRWAEQERELTRQQKRTTEKPRQPGNPRHHKPLGYLEKTETANGLATPVNIYPIFEQALRKHHGKSLTEHSSDISKLWSGFSKVAARYPEHSWFPTARSTEEIMSVDGKQNRYVGFPYTKFHCSVVDVNQSAALILTSVAEARRWKIPEERWVYLHGCADCIEKESLERPDLHRSPAMGAAGLQALQDANLDISRISQFDLYSCFPVAVEVGVSELGISPDVAADPSKLTVTGGLPFHGGPGANYVMHSIAAMVEHVRTSPSTFGMVTANGGFMSKHAAGIYSTIPYSETHPKASHWSRTSFEDVQAKLDQAPAVPVTTAPQGRGLVESYTVLHGRSGEPQQAICVGRLVEGVDGAGAVLMGPRFGAVCRDPRQLKAMIETDHFSAQVHVEHDEKSGQNTFSLASSRL